jgi:hypothetical protein
METYRKVGGAAVLLVASTVLVTHHSLAAAPAVQKTRKNDAGARSEQPRTSNRSEFSQSADDEMLGAPSDGLDRLQEIEELARRLSSERDAVARERRPFALRRDEMLGEMTQARGRMARNQIAAVAAGRQITQLENQIKLLSGSEARQLQSLRSRLQSQFNSLVRELKADGKLLDDRATQVNALNLQMSSLEQRMHSLNEELSECRNQWLRIQQPLEKYSHGDFEGLRRVLDDWLVLDSQWPEAFGWAALCAYELDEIDAAANYVKKAEALRWALTGSKRKWPHLEALTALIYQKQPGYELDEIDAAANYVKKAEALRWALTGSKRKWPHLFSV